MSESHKPKDFIIHPGTFGASKAAKVLEDMMNNGMETFSPLVSREMISIKDKHKTLSLIVSACRSFKAIKQMPDKKVAEHCQQLMLQHYLGEIKRLNFPTKFSSHLKNVVMHHSRRIGLKPGV